MILIFVLHSRERRKGITTPSAVLAFTYPVPLIGREPLPCDEHLRAVSLILPARFAMVQRKILISARLAPGSPCRALHVSARANPATTTLSSSSDPSSGRFEDPIQSAGKTSTRACLCKAQVPVWLDEWMKMMQGLASESFCRPVRT